MNEMKRWTWMNDTIMTTMRRRSYSCMYVCVLTQVAVRFCHRPSSLLSPPSLYSSSTRWILTLFTYFHLFSSFSPHSFSFLCVYACTFTHLHVPVCVCMYAYVFMRIHVYECMCVQVMRPILSLSAWFSSSLSSSMYVYMHTCIHAHLHRCTHCHHSCICMNHHEWVSMCMHVCVCMCVDTRFFSIHLHSRPFHSCTHTHIHS